MEFRILGPLEIRQEGRPLKLAAGKQRSLLAMLLLHANEVVSRDRLIDAVWGENPPETAATALRVHITEVRKLLEPGRSKGDPYGIVLSGPHGYSISVGRAELDLLQFEGLAEQASEALETGDLPGGAVALRQALALWRGPALGELAYEPFAQVAIARLEELRLAALERRIELDLDLGRHAELVPEVEQLVAEHPLRERLRGQLMLALYRSGRQADALAVYREARQAMADELGIEPSQKLQQLEQSILRQDPELDSAPQPAQVIQTPVQAAEESVPERSLLVVPQDEDNAGALLGLAVPLARKPPREVIFVRLAQAGEDLGEATSAAQERRKELTRSGIPTRAAAFASNDPGRDVLRLASDQDVDLLLCDAPEELTKTGELTGLATALLSDAPCDVGLMVPRGRLVLDGEQPVMVPVGGAEHEWAAVELGAWLASACGVPLVLLGSAADDEAGGPDASRLLAHASLATQKGLGVPAEPKLVPRGDEGVVEASADAGLLVLGLSDRWRQDGLGATRLAVLQKAPVSTLLVRSGLRPGGLAPGDSLTRFTWALSGGFG